MSAGWVVAGVHTGRGAASILGSKSRGRHGPRVTTRACMAGSGPQPTPLHPTPTQERTCAAWNWKAASPCSRPTILRSRNTVKPVLGESCNVAYMFS